MVTVLAAFAFIALCARWEMLSSFFPLQLARTNISMQQLKGQQVLL